MHDNIQQQQHEMRLQKTYSSGEEAWNCLTCGRRLLLRWPPEFKKTVLELGDPNAIHSGGKGGLRIGSLQVQREETPLTKEWQEWLDEAGFDQWWDKPSQ